MKVESFKAEGLAQLSYLVADPSAGEAVVIDPRRDIEPYLAALEERQWVLKAILETHLHADFLSGASSLEAVTGAPWRTGPGGAPDGSKAVPFEEGETLALGEGQLVPRHVPGHSPDHLLYRLQEDPESAPWAIFTGDLLFASSVGRPDLSEEATPEELAGMLYHSLQDEVLKLADGVVVFPGHGAGSACGPDIGPRDLTTVGYERAHNRLLQIEGKEAFVEAVLEALSAEPVFYRRLKRANREGVAPSPGLPFLQALPLEAFEARAGEDGVIVVDGRETTAFASGSIPGSLNLPTRDSFPTWAGRTLAPEDRLLLVAEDASQLQAMRRHFFRLGLDRLEGSLAGGFRTWAEAGREVWRERVESAPELDAAIADEQREGALLDVRSEAEYASGTLPGAVHCSIIKMAEEGRLPELERDEPVTVFCGSDFRATLASSLLRRAGFSRVRLLLGSMKAWRAEGGPLEEPTR